MFSATSAAHSRWRNRFRRAARRRWRLPVQVSSPHASPRTARPSAIRRVHTSGAGLCCLRCDEDETRWKLRHLGVATRCPAVMIPEPRADPFAIAVAHVQPASGAAECLPPVPRATLPDPPNRRRAARSRTPPGRHAELLFQPPLYIGPLGRKDAVVHAVPQASVPDDHMAAQNPFLDRTDPAQRGARLLVQCIRLELHANAAERLEGV